MDDYDKIRTSVSRIKAEREKGFPYAVLEKGHCVDIVASEASVAMDKTRILNAICDVDPAKLDEMHQLRNQAMFGKGLTFAIPPLLV